MFENILNFLKKSCKKGKEQGKLGYRKGKITLSVNAR